MTILVALALAAFLLVAALYTELVLNPRYFMLPAIAATVAVAVWLDRADPRRRSALLMIAVAANLLMLSVENTHPRWAAQALVIAARTYPDVPIVTDPDTYHRALMPIGWDHLAMVERGAPRPGTLYLASGGDGPPGALVVARYPSPRTPMGALMEELRIAPFLPGSIRRRLIAPNPTASLVRVPG